MKGDRSGCAELVLGCVAAVVTGSLLMTFAPAVGEILYFVMTLVILIGLPYLVYRYIRTRRFEQEQVIVGQQYAISEADWNEEEE